MRVDRMLDLLCDLEVRLWIFKVKNEIAIFQQWEGRFTWNEVDVIQKDVGPTK